MRKVKQNSPISLRILQKKLKNIFPQLIRILRPSVFIKKTQTKKSHATMSNKTLVSWNRVKEKTAVRPGEGGGFLVLN